MPEAKAKTLRDSKIIICQTYIFMALHPRFEQDPFLKPSFHHLSAPKISSIVPSHRPRAHTDLVQNALSHLIPEHLRELPVVSYSIGTQSSELAP